MTGQRGRWDTTQACERFGQLHTEPVCPASPSEPACLDVGRLRQGKPLAAEVAPKGLIIRKLAAGPG